VHVEGGVIARVPSGNVYIHLLSHRTHSLYEKTHLGSRKSRESTVHVEGGVSGGAVQWEVRARPLGAYIYYCSAPVVVSFNLPAAG
jgi:hypothetical protein